VRLAEEGADIVAFDICRQIDTVPYPLATTEDLQGTVQLVEALGRRIVATETDVRDGKAATAAVGDGVAQLGRLDIVVANAGITSCFAAEPASTRSSVPVMYRPWSETRKTTALLMSTASIHGIGSALSV
jgi:NAD(P)-dependent dehydrogenase (short-subunit alcohol dehydrogenase family)